MKEALSVYVYIYLLIIIYLSTYLSIHLPINLIYRLIIYLFMYHLLSIIYASIIYLPTYLSNVSIYVCEESLWHKDPQRWALQTLFSLISVFGEFGLSNSLRLCHRSSLECLPGSPADSLKNHEFLLHVFGLGLGQGAKTVSRVGFQPVQGCNWAKTKDPPREQEGRLGLWEM